MRAGAWWPLGLIGVLGVTIAANVWMLFVASAQDAAVVEPDYYRKAVHWDDEVAQQRHNAELGWSLAVQLGPMDTDGTATIEAILRDRDGNPVTGATIQVIAIHNRAGRTRPTAKLHDSGAGIYRATLALGHRGLWELRFDVERRLPEGTADRFTAVVRSEAI
jgi:nitrogen fixation protein FixH